MRESLLDRETGQFYVFFLFLFTYNCSCLVLHMLLSMRVARKLLG
jgi:hypothetical protein